MKETVLWQCLRLTAAGVIRYEILCSPGAEPYGARIAVRGQSEAVRNVTADCRKMMQWMRSMAKGGVRPCHLRDILEDLILEED